MNNKTQINAFYNILDAIPASIYWKDISGKYLGCNKYMLEMTGMARKDIVGKTDRELIWKDIADDLQQIDNLVIKNKAKYEVEEIPSLANHQKRTYLSTKTPLYDETSGEVVGMIGVSIDITDRKRADQLQKEKEVSDQISRAIEMLSSSIAHEVRTPLSVVNINVDNLSSEFKNFFSAKGGLKPVEEKQKDRIQKLIDNIRLAVKSGSGIVNMLLVKLRSVFNNNTDSTKLEPNSIKFCINDAISEYPFYNNERENIIWNDKLNEDFTYIGNYLLTKHMLFNLIKNALKAIKEAGKGKVYISLRAEKDVNCLIFKDTALGIPAKFLDSIFQQFSSGNKEGTGLGLAFCKMSMLSYGGDIICNSKVGESTEFVLSFPKA